MTESRSAPEVRTVETDEGLLLTIRDMLGVIHDNPNGLELSDFRSKVVEATGLDAMSVLAVSQMLSIEGILDVEQKGAARLVVATDAGYDIIDDWDGFAEYWNSVE